jgi:hypothetical protein
MGQRAHPAGSATEVVRARRYFFALTFNGLSVKVSALAPHENGAVPDSPTSFSMPLLGNERVPERCCPAPCTSYVAVPDTAPNVNVMLDPLRAYVPLALPFSVTVPSKVPIGDASDPVYVVFVVSAHVVSENVSVVPGPERVIDNEPIGVEIGLCSWTVW